VSKIGVVAEEADESAFWIELLADAGVMKKERLAELLERSPRPDCDLYSIQANSKTIGRTQYERFG